MFWTGSDGKLLRASPFGAMNWATHVDMETGRPVENPDGRLGGQTPVDPPRQHWRPQLGAHGLRCRQGSWPTFPRTTRRSSSRSRRDYLETGVYTPRRNRMNLGVATGSYRTRLIEAAGERPEPKGFLKAFDPLTGETVWKIRNRTARIGGVLATGGGLVFQG